MCEGARLTSGKVSSLFAVRTVVSNKSLKIKKEQSKWMQKQMNGEIALVGQGYREQRGNSNRRTNEREGKTYLQWLEIENFAFYLIYSTVDGEQKN